MRLSPRHEDADPICPGDVRRRTHDSAETLRHCLMHTIGAKHDAMAQMDRIASIGITGRRITELEQITACPDLKLLFGKRLRLGR